MTNTDYEDTVFPPETTQTICPCGVKHDEFVTPFGRFQYCTAENYLYVLEFNPPECEEKHDPDCKLQHLKEHEHSLGSDLKCKQSFVEKCDSFYTGGNWTRKPDAANS